MIYLYCITGSTQLPLLPAESVFPVFPPYTICAAGLAAVVSRVPNEEYDPEKTPQRVMDRLWVEQRSPAHEAVVNTVLLQTTVVPVAFSTVLDDEDQVTAYLEANVEVLEAQIDMLRDRQEFWVDIERAGRRPKSEGLGELRARLCVSADGFMERRVCAYNPRKRLGSWSFLVKREQRGRFLSEAWKIAGECKERRLVVDCSGPWVAGSFALAPPAGPMLISRPA